MKWDGLCVVAGGSSLPEASRRCIANWEGGGSADDTKSYNDHIKKIYNDHVKKQNDHNEKEESGSPDPSLI